MKENEKVFDILYYILCVGAFFSGLSVFKFFRRDKMINELKERVFKLENELIGKDEIIKRQKEIIDGASNKRGSSNGKN